MKMGKYLTLLYPFPFSNQNFSNKFPLTCFPRNKEIRNMNAREIGIFIPRRPRLNIILAHIYTHKNNNIINMELEKEKSTFSLLSTPH